MSESERIKPTFAVVGLGFIADRHIQAIEDVGGALVMACDTDINKFHKAGNALCYRRWTDMHQSPLFANIDYVSICTPNNLHLPMTEYFCAMGKKIICEKPTVIESKHLNKITAYDDLINNVVQLRYNEELAEMRGMIQETKVEHTAEFKIHIYRDKWYFNSWKNDRKQSGGLLFNIGIHYFDLLTWFFGKPTHVKLFNYEDNQAHGEVFFNGCKAKWSLAINAPIDNQQRYFMVDGKKINLSKGFERLHTKVYEEVLADRGIKIRDIKPALSLVESIMEESYG